MTTLYVSSVSGDNTDGSTWAKAYTTVSGALAALTGTGPHIVYVDSAHSFTSSGVGITYSPAVDGQSIAILSVDRNGSTTTGHNGWVAGATEGSSDAFGFGVGSGSTNVGYFYFYGLTLRTGTGGGAGNSLNLCTNQNRHFVTFVNCKLQTRGTSTSPAIIIGSTSGSVAEHGANITFIDCELTTKNSATTRAILMRTGRATFIRSTHAYQGATKSPFLFGFSTVGGGSLIQCFDCDWSGFNSGNYFDVSSMTQSYVYLVNCKLNATPGIVTGTFPTGSASSITLVNTDDADTANVFEYRNAAGTLVVDTAIYRNDGAKCNGAGIGWKIDTTAVCSEAVPFVTPWLHRHVTATGSRDFTIELLRDSATDYTNREVWAEFETVEDASFPLGTLTSSRNANPFDGTGVDLTNSVNGSWTETLTNDNEMLITATRTTAEKSMIRARLNIAVASTTLYLDPQLSISGQPNNCPTRWTVEGAVNAEPVAPKANYIAGL